MKQFAIILLAFSSLIHNVICENEAIIDDLKIRGSILKSHHGHDYYAFRGIPYAKPPIGERRFKDPEPYGKFDNIFDATKDGNLCTQLKKHVHPDPNLRVSEDCLNLNVYTKSLNKEKKNPVIVFIHGGAYLFGSGISDYYNPKYLLDEDIVLVTLNYRLGPFGFLVSGTKDAVGNYAFKDQVLALKWVQDNIELFGGDPNSVTLSGQSAGSMSSILHMISPMSKNLFHKVIAMSGSPTHHWVPDNIKWTKILAESVECPTDQGDKMVECLREKPWEILVNNSVDWRDEPFGVGVLKWNYEIEKNFGQERFLTDDPSVLFKKGNFHRVPLMTGITKEEFDDFAHVLELKPDLFNEFSENFNKFAPTFFGYNSKNYDFDLISEKLKKFYFKDKPITISTKSELGEIFSDSLISHGVHRLVQFASEYEDVYYYRMDYKGNQTCSFKNSDGKPLYVAHADILVYLFHVICAPEFEDTDPDFIMVKRFLKYFTNFARSGNPNTGLNEDDVKCTDKWIPSVKGNIKALYIDEICSINGAPFQDRLNLWDKLFPVN